MTAVFTPKHRSSALDQEAFPVQKPAAIIALPVSLLTLISPNLFLLYSSQAIPHGELLSNILAPAVAGLTLLAAANVRAWIGLCLIAPWSVLAVLEGFFIARFGQPSSTHIYGIIGESTLEEASIYLQGIGIWLTLACLTASAANAILVIGAYRLQWRWNLRIRRWILTAGGLLAIALLFLTSESGLTFNPAVAEPATERDALASYRVSPEAARFIHSYPIGIPIRVIAYLNQSATLRDMEQRLANYRFHARSSTHVQSRKIYVLVIGETGRPDHWQLNGYERETTPRLATLDRLVSFTDFVTSWAWTRMSVPVMLSRKPDDDANAFFPERSLISAVREAGFKTYWLSTQPPLGPHDSSIGLYAREADEVRFLNPSDYKGDGVYDGVLLEPLREILSREESKVFVVLHTLGSHYNYASRYPEEFDSFQPSLKGHRDASLHDRSQRERMINSYDNSVLYTDFVLAEVIQLLDASGAASFLFFAADHGENLFDGECDKSGHGRNTERDYRIPAFWWHSREYASAFPQKVASVTARSRAPLATSGIFHSLLDAAGITFDGLDLTRSLFSPEWQPHPRRVQSGLYFDDAERDPVCGELRPTALSRS